MPSSCSKQTNKDKDRDEVKTELIDPEGEKRMMRRAMSHSPVCPPVNQLQTKLGNGLAELVPREPLKDVWGWRSLAENRQGYGVVGGTGALQGTSVDAMTFTLRHLVSDARNTDL